jgi:hypothetical protein
MWIDERPCTLEWMREISKGHCEPLWERYLLGRVDFEVGSDSLVERHQ